MDQRILQIIAQMTLEEKASLCSGQDYWHLKGIERLNIPRIAVADGPHGLRKQLGENVDHIGLHESVKATCFPTASCTACAWDKDLMYDIGVSLAESCLAYDVQVLLGPGVNIKRSPLCGRNFEYFSEDPYLSGELATSFINGVQSMGVGASIKHFAANNQEYRRMTVDAIIDERTLREIYLPAFEQAVKQAAPLTVMCAYNRLNGTYCSDHHRLLTQILRNEWQYDGVVVSDWGACNDRVISLGAGMDLEMPGNGGVTDKKIVKALKREKRLKAPLSSKASPLNEADLDRAVYRILQLIFTTHSNRQPHYELDLVKQHALAKKAALSSMVLLKNQGHILPLTPSSSLLVVGEFFETPRYQGCGSSYINPNHLVSAKQAMDALKHQYTYTKGYSLLSDEPDKDRIEEAVNLASSGNYDIVCVFCGLTDDYESEGYDRAHLELPESHNSLIAALCAIHKRIVVVLHNGSPVGMPWLYQVEAVLEAYLGGEATGEAVVDLLFGYANPSGKLAETFPRSVESCASSAYFSPQGDLVEYREGLYVGYRDDATFNKAVLFPFGHGLSYTEFSYANLQLSRLHINCNESVNVSVDITNVGHRFGSEVVQLYVHAHTPTLHRPEQELRRFLKVHLEPGQTKTVYFQLDKRAFAYYHVELGDWHVATGDYHIRIGSSSRSIHLTQAIHVVSVKENIEIPDLRPQQPEFYNRKQRFLNISDQTFKSLLRGELPPIKMKKRGTYDINATLGDVRHTFIGRLIYLRGMAEFYRLAKENGQDEIKIKKLTQAMEEMPLRSAVLMTNGALDFERLQMIIDLINGKYIKALQLWLTSSIWHD